MWAALSLAVTAGSALLQGSAQSKADESAAKVAKMNAFAARISTAIKAQDLKEAGERLEGSQRVAAAYSGVDVTSGSAATVMVESARQVEREIHRVKYTGKLQEQGAMTTAAAMEKSADYSTLGGVLNAGATIIGGFGKLKSTKVG